MNKKQFSEFMDYLRENAPEIYKDFYDVANEKKGGKAEPFENFEFERGSNGELTPTLKNREIMEHLKEKYKSGAKMTEAIGKKYYLDYLNAIMSDPRQPNIFYLTKEHAHEKTQYAKMLDEMDRKYLESKKK